MEGRALDFLKKLSESFGRSGFETDPLRAVRAEESKIPWRFTAV
jgi:hypothetical protein